MRLASALVVVLPALPALATAAEPTGGKAIFADFCASCHGLDGRARTPAGRKVRAKDLSESKATDEQIRERIMNGLRDEHGASRMPSFSDRLSPTAVAALIPYVKSFRR